VLDTLSSDIISIKVHASHNLSFLNETNFPRLLCSVVLDDDNCDKNSDQFDRVTKQIPSQCCTIRVYPRLVLDRREINLREATSLMRLSRRLNTHGQITPRVSAMTDEDNSSLKLHSSLTLRPLSPLAPGGSSLRRARVNGPPSRLNVKIGLLYRLFIFDYSLEE